jgi:hypothetical protein
LRPADAGHGAEAFGNQQHPVADAGVYCIYRDNGVAAIRAIEIQRLHHEQLAALMARVLLSGDQFTDYARDEHAQQSTESTIPTMVLSVGTSVGRNGKLDSLPLHQ